MKRVLLTAMVLGALGWLMLENSAAVSQDADKVLTNVSHDQLQKLLDASGKTYTKQAKVFVVKLGNYEVFLESFYEGKALVAGCNGFKKVSLERINQWNDQHALSRAILRKEESRLEADLNCELGVTVKTFDLFLERFKASLAHFDTFVGGGVKQVTGPIGPTGPINAVNAVSQAFPAKAAAPETRWDIEWDLVKRGSDKRYVHLLRIASAKFNFRDKAGVWKSVMVARNLQLVEAYSSYHDGKTSWLDVGFGIADKTIAPTEELKGPNCVAPSQILADLNDPKHKIFKEVHDDGLRLMGGFGKNHGHRGEKLALWSMFQAVNYVYLVEFDFTDDGRIVCRLGFTAHNYFDRGKSPEDPPGVKDGDVHVHIGCWRMNFDLMDVTDLDKKHGGPTENKHLLVSQQLDKTIKRYKISEDVFGADPARGGEELEGKALWKPEEFTTLRVQSTKVKNAHGKFIAYDLMPLRMGSVRDLPAIGNTQTAQANMDFVNYDFWITRSKDAGLADRLPYHKVPDQAKDRLPLKGHHATVWYSAPGLHVPRGEDFGGVNGVDKFKGVALTTWIEFTLRPRDLFDTTPFFASVKKEN
jgi:Copper amine oxidase, enzyme domain